MNEKELRDRLNAPLCPSGKRGYPDQKTAAAALGRITHDPRLRTGKQPKRAYDCPLCGQAHLTSITGKRSPKGRR